MFPIRTALARKEVSKWLSKLKDDIKRLNEADAAERRRTSAVEQKRRQEAVRRTLAAATGKHGVRGASGARGASGDKRAPPKKGRRRGIVVRSAAADAQRAAAQRTAAAAPPAHQIMLSARAGRFTRGSAPVSTGPGVRSGGTSTARAGPRARKKRTVSTGCPCNR
jgi:hypothetical protein